MTRPIPAHSPAEATTMKLTVADIGQRRSPATPAASRGARPVESVARVEI
ncbi:MAG: hypothetical protein ACM3YN_10330 [Parcubacteria group bacterium]